MSIRISLLLSFLIHGLFIFLSIFQIEIDHTIQQKTTPSRIEVELVYGEPKRPVAPMLGTAPKAHPERKKQSFLKKEGVEKEANKEGKDLVSKSLEFIRNSEIQTTVSPPVLERTPIEKMYIDNWRMKVKIFGNLNYPVEAARNNITGDLVLVAIILADGNLKDVYVGRSSGKKILDDAAVYFVKRTSPFSKFPKKMGGRNELTIKSRFVFPKDTTDID